MAKKSPAVEFIQFIIILILVFCFVRVFSLYAGVIIVKLPIDPYLWPITNFIKGIDFDYYLKGTMDLLDRLLAFSI